MILPIQASLERVPNSLINASYDLGASKRQTFYKVILPLALPGIAAGSIFTFSLTLGDYIIPYIIGTSKFFIGQAVYTHQGTAGNVPLAAAFSLVPIAVMTVYIYFAKKLGHLMPSKFNLNKASFGLKFGAIVGILFLHIPLFLIILYAFTTEDKSYQFPPPGYTLKWFSIVLIQRRYLECCISFSSCSFGINICSYYSWNTCSSSAL